MGKDETPISYMDYYRNKYGINISNRSQPLFVARLPLRDRRAGKDELLYLIPELCRATGKIFILLRNNKKIIIIIN